MGHVMKKNTYEFKMGLNPHVISPSRLLKESRMLSTCAWPFMVGLQMNVLALLLEPWPRRR